MTSCYRKKNSARYCEPEKFLLLPPPPPLNLAGLWRSRKISATTPPPPNLVGLRRSWKSGPPPNKNPDYAVGRYCRFLNAINALLRLLSPEYKLASRCDWVFSCDLIFIPKFFGCPTHRWPTLFALPMDHRTTKTFDNMVSSSLVRSRYIAVLFPLPQNVHGA